MGKICDFFGIEVFPPQTMLQVESGQSRRRSDTELDWQQGQHRGSAPAA
jgi:hypothetical protein